MSTHPNAVLLLLLKPQDLTLQTYRRILEDAGKKPEEDIEIDGTPYNVSVIEDGGYYEDMQIGGDTGDIAVFDLVTYGYGELIEWSKLQAKKDKLEEWAKAACETYRCTYTIHVTANYW